MQSDFIEQLQNRLLELGCPAVHMRRLVGEIADHREDLKQAAIAAGSSEAEAEAKAQTQLGNPFDLARQKMVMLRQSSWWGRHFLVSFCLLPLLTAPILWLLFLLCNASLVALGFALEGYGWSLKQLGVSAENPVTFHHMVLLFGGANYLATALVALLFCWLARRAMVETAWMAIACIICSLYTSLLWARIHPHSFAFGFFFPPHCDWIRLTIPLLVFGIFYAYQRRSTHVWRTKVLVC